MVTDSSDGPGYDTFVRTAYDLVGNQRGRTDDIWMINAPSPGAITAYLRDGTGLEKAARGRYSAMPDTSDAPPPGLPVFVVNPSQVVALQALGAQVEQVAPGRDLWSVR